MRKVKARQLRFGLFVGAAGLSGCFNPSDVDIEGTTGNHGSTSGVAGSTSEATSSETSDGSSSSSGEASTSGAPGCTAPDGEVDPMCESPTPLCWAGECIGCDALDAGCAALDALAPICDPDGACSPCLEHGQCESGACVPTTGACVTARRRLWVDAAADCDAGVGTEVAPFCEVGPAAEAVASQPGDDAWAIIVAGAAVPYTESLVWSSEHPLVVVGPREGVAAEIDGTDSFAVRAIGGGHLFLSHLVLTGGNLSVVLECIYAGADTRLWVDDTTVVGGSAPFVADCDAVFRRSAFEGGPEPKGVTGSLTLEDSTIALGGGLSVSGTLVSRRNVFLGQIDVSGGSLTMENSFVRREDFPEPASIVATDGATVDILYSTITSGYGCDGGGPSAIRNSIVVGQACPSAQIDHSAVDSGVGQGDGNVQVTEAMLADVLVSTTDLHLRPDAPLVLDLAIWDEGDPEFDIDGDPRPTVPGSTDAAGADVLSAR